MIKGILESRVEALTKRIADGDVYYRENGAVCQRWVNAMPAAAEMANGRNMETGNGSK
jgi:hypothetical protein